MHELLNTVIKRKYIENYQPAMYNGNFLKEMVNVELNAMNNQWTVDNGQLTIEVESGEWRVESG
jgi:hypothetical protein